MLTPEDLKLPDEELGVRLLSICIAHEAVAQGIPLNNITVENEFAVKFASWVLEELPGLETDRHDLSTLQKALRNAVGGQTDLAGRLLKDLVADNARNAATLNLLVTEIQNKLKGRKAGGAETAKLRKTELAPRNAEICRKADELRKSGRAERNIPGILAEQFPLGADQIRRIIRKGK